MIIKFYGTNDMATIFCMNEAFEFLEKYVPSAKYNFNEILCLENCIKYIDYEIFPNYFDEKEREQIKNKRPDILKTIGSFWNGLKANDLEKMPIIEKEYHDDFLASFVKFRLSNVIPKDLFWKIVKKNHIGLRDILVFEDLVKWLDDDARNSLMNEPSGMELLADVILVKRENRRFFLPKSLSEEDIDNTMARFIDCGDTNLVKLIFESSKEMGISDKTRLKAKRKYEKYVDNCFEKTDGVEFGVKVQIIKNQAAPFLVNTDNNITLISYSEEFFLKSLEDEASIFKVLKMSFGIVGSDFVMRLPSYQSELGIFERYLLLSGKKHYPGGFSFEIKNLQTIYGLIVYEKFLKRHGRSIEDVIVWFFDVYLNNRCNTKGFRYSKSTSDTFYEKAKNLFTEMDAVAKQFKMFVEDGVIDEELLEISSAPIDYREIKSMKKNKYYYLNEKKKEARLVLDALFSDQSHLNYIDEPRHDVNLFSLLANFDMKRDDFQKYQKPHIDWLIDLGFLKVNDTGKIEVTIFAWLFGVLNKIEVIPYYSCNDKVRKDIDKLVKDGWLVSDDRLLTVPEVEYFDYILNRRRFTNGLDLRNKYIHGSKSLVDNENVHEMAYMRGLLLMIALAIKIDDDIRV